MGKRDETDSLLASPTRQATRSKRSRKAPRRSGTADAFVVFGISGDLAKVMTFNSLYRLEARGLLDCPIVGVAFDDWSDKDLREHARRAIETSSGKKGNPKVFNRLAKRLTYLQGDFAEADTYRRLAAQIKGARNPVFYLEIPPSLFGLSSRDSTPRASPKRRGWWSRSRSVTISHPPGTLRRNSVSYPEDQLYRIDHFLDILVSGRSSTYGSRTPCSSPSGIATPLSSVQITMAESFGVDYRGSFYDPWAPTGRCESTT